MVRGATNLTARIVSAAAVAGILFGSAFWSDAVLAANRVALVVGNSNYQNVARLPNPGSDAVAIADMLSKAGFTVDLETDLANLAFKHAIRRFAHDASGADMAVVFFAGHGFEIGGSNYLIPVDARLADEWDAPDEAIPLDRLLEAVRNAKKLALIMLDACRDNPFLVTMKRETVSRTISRGLARVEPEGTDTMIAYAAKAGSVADDGRGPHSPFTTALLDNLTTRGLDVQLALRRVRDEVLKITDGRQEPFVYGSLGGKVVTLVPGPDQARPTPSGDIRQDFELAREIGTAEAWTAFLATYKTGFYADLAKAALAKANEGQQVATVERPAPATKVPAPTDDALAWDRLKNSTDAEVLKQFAAQYPDSALRKDAEARIAALEAAGAAKPPPPRPDEVAWSFLKDTMDAHEVKRFIAQYPDSALRKDAEARLAALEAVQTAWNNVKDSNDPGQLRRFVEQYPNSVQRADAEQRIASLTAQPPAVPSAPDPHDLVRSLQLQLKRVGCFSGTLNGEFDNDTKTAWHRFTRLTSIKVPDDATPDALNAVRAIKKRVCPLICRHGEHAEDDSCVANKRPPKRVAAKQSPAHRVAPEAMPAESSTPRNRFGVCLPDGECGY
jgi:hypothetical protein